MNKKGQEQIISEPQISEQPKKSRTWIWILILAIILLAIGAGFYFFKSPAADTNSPAVSSSVDTGINKVMCDGRNYSLTIAPGYIIARIEIPEAEKQKILDLETQGFVSSLYEIPLPPISEVQSFSQSAFDPADLELGFSASGSGAIFPGRAMFLVYLSETKYNALFEKITVSESTGIESIYANNMDTQPKTIYYSCKIQ